MTPAFQVPIGPDKQGNLTAYRRNGFDKFSLIHQAWCTGIISLGYPLLLSHTTCTQSFSYHAINGTRSENLHVGKVQLGTVKANPTRV